MNIQTVANNLRNTIAGKEKMLEQTQKAREFANLPDGNDAALFATVEFLKINIDELQRILQDVEQCAKKESDDSWITNPDRSGGQYTDEEIRRGSEWR